MFWERVRKSNYCGIDKLQLSVYDSVAVFICGRQVSVDILQLLNITPGLFSSNACHALNVRRKYNTSYKNIDTSKRRRKISRGVNKKKDDSHVLKEGKTYETGGFN